MTTIVLSDPAPVGEARARGAGRADTVRHWTSDIYGGGVEATANRFVRHRFRPHTHDTLMLGLIETGSKLFARERGAHIATPGAISIVNPGELHTGERAAGAELRYRALYIPCGLLALAMRRHAPEPEGASVAFRDAVIGDDAVYAAMVRAHDAIVSGAPLLARESCLLEALAGLVGRHASWAAPERSAAAAPKEVRLVRDLIDARFADELSVAELSVAAGLSPYHLMRQFRRFVGLPIHAYQIQVRIEAAKALLGSGLAVVEVALDVGFADQSHFSKRFKDLIGASPAAYQRAISV
jgi:AraC-like DNA-binding protein